MDAGAQRRYGDWLGRNFDHHIVKWGLYGAYFHSINGTAALGLRDNPSPFVESLHDHLDNADTSLRHLYLNLCGIVDSPAIINRLDLVFYPLFVVLFDRGFKPINPACPHYRKWSSHRHKCFATTHALRKVLGRNAATVVGCHLWSMRSSV